MKEKVPQLNVTYRSWKNNDELEITAIYTDKVAVLNRTTNESFTCYTRDFWENHDTEEDYFKTLQEIKPMFEPL